MDSRHSDSLLAEKEISDQNQNDRILKCVMLNSIQHPLIAENKIPDQVRNDRGPNVCHAEFSSASPEGDSEINSEWQIHHTKPSLSCIRKIKDNVWLKLN